MIDKIKELLQSASNTPFPRMALNISINAIMVWATFYSVDEFPSIGVIDSLMIATTMLSLGFVPTDYMPDFKEMGKVRLIFTSLAGAILGILWLLNSIF